MAVPIMIAGGVRTALGNFSGSLAGLAMTDVAAHAARACLERADLKPEAIDHLVFTTTVPSDADSLFAPRVVAMKAGLGDAMPALGVVRACGSGLQALISAGQQVSEGHSRLTLAGGAESYSRAPYVLTQARHGAKRGPQTIEDMLDWAYRCPLTGLLMGETAENLANDYQYGRAEMDEWGAMSQARAVAAIDSGFLARQITPITVPDGRSTRVFAVDEFPRRDATREKLGRLKPAFREDGRVTAGSSSGVTDGAAFMLVGTAASLGQQGVRPQARIVDWCAVGVPARIMGHGPVPAIGKLLARQGLGVDAIDVFEINEAFAVVNLHAERQLGIPRDRHNLHGGGISIGHPPGVTGLRMAMTAIQHLEETGGRRAVLAMCLGGGQGLAMLIERV